ncbi:sigma-70 family RNA polymerase sigma factor [Sphingobium sp. AN558]|uniref:RNA polymerase sigma factor n=2 Tax=Sphingobium sp. AN558 TaxID=3133442 RepID=UPI0030C61AAB
MHPAECGQARCWAFSFPHVISLTMKPFSDDRALWIARHILPHEPALRACLSRWRLPTDLDPEDVVQEAYSRFAQMDSVDRILDPRAYLFSVARTILLMHVRHARVISIRAIDETDALLIAADEPSPEVQVSDREQLHLLAIAVSELPESWRRAFLLRMIDELPYRDIGERLGISDNAVQKLIAKSLGRLITGLGRSVNAGAGASKKKWQQRVREHDGETRDERGN